jgi:hypothetical protein
MDVRGNTSLTFEDINIFPYPNPALANILLGSRMQAIVATNLAKVLTVFLSLQASEVYRDPKRQFRSGGHPPGQLMAQTSASVDIGAAFPGKTADRWTGQITVGVEYAGAEFYGRHSYAQYAGNRNLQQALRAVFPS